MLSTVRRLCQQQQYVTRTFDSLWSKKWLSTSCQCAAWSTRSPVKVEEKKKDENLSNKDARGKKLGPDIKSLKDAPKAALGLGAGGLIPFVAPPLVMLATGYYVPLIHEMQVIYGATILSFLGGARWGVAVTPGSGVQPDWKSLGFSVAPPLLAWLALILSPSLEVKTSVMVFGLTFALFHDALVPGYVPWFKTLRLLLTVIATLGLGLCNVMAEREKEGRMVKYDMDLDDLKL